MALAPTQSLVETPSRVFYREAMEVLNRAGVPFLVGGAFAFIHQAGIDKSTKDLDIFARPRDVQRLLEACAAAGYETDLVFSHWLAKIRSSEGFIDVIFNSGNGVAAVDDEWFEHATAGEVLSVPVKIAPPEETVWSKAFVMERERYDGADVVHLILAHGERLDWGRLLARFGPHWRVLLAHLVLFGFIFPSERSRVPGWVMEDLVQRLQSEIGTPDATDAVCYGTLLSWSQYLGDVLGGSFRDARIRPFGNMSAEEVARWTAADKR
ncbi:MAG TPA: nucleotidyltransferase [Gemmatimonadales bacterium]|nr:nucleotidyltransferase [Gemmatimonadales bacterium]